MNEEHCECMTLCRFQRAEFRNIERPCFDNQLRPFADGKNRRRRRQALSQVPQPVDVLEEAGDRQMPDLQSAIMSECCQRE